MRYLAEHKIPRTEIGGRFDDVARVLNEVFGSSSRLLVSRQSSNCTRSIRQGSFGFHDSLKDQILYLREKVRW